MCSFTAVLVLYNLPLSDSECFLSLREALAQRANNDDFQLLIYDNSSEAGEPAPFPARLTYLHNPINGGVAAAYNTGLQRARENGCAWLLLLDQDTAITAAYFHELRESTTKVPEDVVAIVPRLAEESKTHSPQSLPRLSHHPLPESLEGLLPVKVSAFNSGAALRVSALKRFPERYWLDFLDHAVFHELQAAGGKVWLLRARLQHRLSTQRLGQDASVSRYLNVLQAERDFYGEYGSLQDVMYYRLRRTKQAVGQLFRIPDKRFALLSARAALGLLPSTPART